MNQYFYNIPAIFEYIMNYDIFIGIVYAYALIYLKYSKNSLGLFI